ncbi:hypothetical protein LWI29_034728 [Acer saccharum]|uniref:Uncharacterized protein n=1 Tax=Acer saccharum TaxID=4024 RepID=A0AA39RTI3_ACESA|nr:hypothetical protein LWI29_034728 [Acer saccharum]
MAGEGEDIGSRNNQELPDDVLGVKTDPTGVPTRGIGRHHPEKVIGTIVENARGARSNYMAWAVRLKNRMLKNKDQVLASVSFNTSGESEGDRDILIQSMTREVQNNMRQMDALVRRYTRNKLSDDESGNPFTNGILRMPFLERFRMPHVE